MHSEKLLLDALFGKDIQDCLFKRHVKWVSENPNHGYFEYIEEIFLIVTKFRIMIAPTFMYE